MSDDKDSLDSVLHDYVARKDDKLGSKFKSTPADLARLMAISNAIKQGKISVDDVPRVLKRFRETGKLFEDIPDEKSRQSPSMEGQAPDSSKVIVLDARPKWWLAVAAAAVIVIGFVLFSTWGPGPDSLAMVKPFDLGVPNSATNALIEDAVVVAVDWKNLTISIPMRDGSKLTGNIVPSKVSGQEAPIVPYAFEVSVRGRSGSGTEIKGNGQLLVRPKEASTPVSRLSIDFIASAKLSLTLNIGGRDQPVYRVFPSP